MRKVSLARRRPLSLNSRVMLFVAVAIGLSLLMIGHLVQNEVERHFAEQDADELVVITRAVEKALQMAKDQALAPEDALARAVSGHHGVYFQVWDDAGRLVYSSVDTGSLPQANTYAPVARIQVDNLYTWQSDGKTYRGTATQRNYRPNVQHHPKLENRRRDGQTQLAQGRPPEPDPDPSPFAGPSQQHG